MHPVIRPEMLARSAFHLNKLFPHHYLLRKQLPRHRQLHDKQPRRVPLSIDAPLVQTRRKRLILKAFYETLAAENAREAERQRQREIHLQQMRQRQELLQREDAERRQREQEAEQREEAAKRQRLEAEQAQLNEELPDQIVAVEGWPTGENVLDGFNANFDFDFSGL